MVALVTCPKLLTGTLNHNTCTIKDQICCDNMLLTEIGGKIAQTTFHYLVAPYTRVGI